MTCESHFNKVLDSHEQLFVQVKSIKELHGQVVISH